ncbi:MAG: hypothetical protein BGN88_13540 [Clostridiales bacterium 43-6]|jgi:hypothetical protein|uniref:hypothetical protein n=1 Tax=Petrimonas sulfuriphila TaxID=285070 RepID=UPI00092A11F6|nr:MAG: hypothetical protein BGN88_13540 [Clostridiales bacterium 43-6]
MKTKQIFRKSLKRGYILLGELHSIYGNQNDNSLDGTLTPEEIQRLEEIDLKIDEPDKHIPLTNENKRSILKYLFGGELPQESDFKYSQDIDRLSEEEQQFLIDVSLKLEGHNKENKNQ